MKEEVRKGQAGARALAEVVLEGAGITGPFSAFDVANRLVRRGYCELRLEAVEMPPGVFGCLIRRGKVATILYRRDSGVFVENTIVFHELAHLILAGAEDLLGFDTPEQAADALACAFLGLAMRRALEETRTCARRWGQVGDDLYFTLDGDDEDE